MNTSLPVFSNSCKTDEEAIDVKFINSLNYSLKKPRQTQVMYDIICKLKENKK